MLSKERSLDEQAIRRRNLEAKRTSCDSLPWGGDALDCRRGTIFESLESDGGGVGGGGSGGGGGGLGGGVSYDLRSVRSADVGHSEMDGDVSLSVVSALVPSVTTPLPPPLSLPIVTPTSTPTPLQLPMPMPMPMAHPPPRRPFGWSQSVDQGCLRSNLLLSVPRSMPPRSRSGSTKQLFKQQALDEDADMDENSLLLPTAAGGGSGPGSVAVIASSSLDLPDQSGSSKQILPDIALGVSKSDSSDILRIISERRRMDQREQREPEQDQDNEAEDRDSDYKELLLVKSPQSSMD